MIHLTIDSREIAVEPGTTLLGAARRLGIHVPTLCHVDGHEPSASCFLCCVQIEGARNLSPACAMPAADGMKVTTDSDDVRASRKMALELLLSDHAGDCVAPCAARCPAGLDIPGFVVETAAGRDRRSMEVISRTLSLPGTLGRVCPRLCEQSCRRCDHDEGLAIAALHRYAADRNQSLARPWQPTAGAPSGRSVAIIGAGPAGLTAAFYLLQAGHACTLFDARSAAGGMLRWAIPAYRLPAAALEAEVAVIERLGARLRLGVRWGDDFSLADLRRDHDAVLVAIGAQSSQPLRCPGADFALPGLELLARVAAGETPDLGRQVIVVGGGNTAMDAARTAARLGASVRVLYRRTRREMPCLMEEVEAAEDEGVVLDYLISPVDLARRDDGRLQLVCLHMELGEPDASGRRRPVPVVDTEHPIACDTVVAAVGQAVERELAVSDGLEVTPWGIAADPVTLATNLPGVFAGGDAVLGADLAVRAVAAGRMAAASINQYLCGEPVTGLERWTDVAMKRIDDSERAAIFRAIEATPRVAAPAVSLGERLAGFAEISLGLTPDQAEAESRRCLSCGCRKADGCLMRSLASEYRIDPYRFTGDRRRFTQDLSHAEIIYEPGKCIVCGACEQIAADAGEPLGLAAAGRGFEVAMAVPFDRPLAEGLTVSARDCAAACPTGALALRTERACDLQDWIQQRPETLGRKLPILATST